MAYVYDRMGNVFEVGEDTPIRRKETIQVFNEKGEEFELDAEVAEEARLTPSERFRLLRELKEKARDLSHRLGICPVIDPVIDPGGGCRFFGCPTFGHRCLAFDPAFPGTFETRPGVEGRPTLRLVLEGIMKACPNIDPTRLGTIFGTQLQEAGVLEQLASCPNMDPPDIQSIVGSVIRTLRQSGAFQRLGVGCRMMDPPDITSIVGTVVQNLFSGGVLEKFRGCPSMDPPDVLSLLNTVTRLEQLTEALER